MRNTQITRPCRTIITALADSSQMNYQRYGAIQAVRASQHRMRIEDLDPHLECNKTRYSLSGNVPTVQFEYDPKQNRGVAGTVIDCTPGAQVSGAVSGTFQMPRTRQLPVTIAAAEWNSICCATDAFFETTHGERLKLKSSAEFYAKMKQLGVIGTIHRAFNKVIDGEFLEPIETDVVASLLAGVGISPTTGSATPINIQAIAPATLSPTTQLQSLANAIARKVNVCRGKWILLTGTGQRAADFFERCGISCCNNQAGLDSAALVQKTSQMFDWYSSTAIDSILGQDAAFLIAPESVAGIFGHNHEDMTAMGKFGLTNYGTVTMANKYCKSEACVNEPDYSDIEFGLRVREQDCYPPSLNIWLDTRYGIWTQPAGFHYSYGPNVGYTGIVRLNFV